MSFVEIPVPIEVLPQVKSYVKWNLGLVRNEIENEDAIPDALSAADDDTRRLVRLISTASVEHDEFTITRAAAALRMHPRYMMGTLNSFNFLVSDLGGPAALIFRKANPLPAGPGEDKWARCLMVMPQDFARRALDALR